MALPQYFKAIIREQKGFCYYCEHRMHEYPHQDGVRTPLDAITKDHLIPRVRGGGTNCNNIVAACFRCNNLRKEVDAEVFRSILTKLFKKNPHLWLCWHNLPAQELHVIHQRCVLAQERRLRGKARKYPHIAYDHQEFSRREQRTLARA